LPARHINQYYVTVLQAASSSASRNLARVLTEKFGRGRLLVIGGDRADFEQQCAAAGLPVTACRSMRDLDDAMSNNNQEPEFERAVWFYAGSEGDEEIQKLAQHTTDILFVPSQGTEIMKTRPKIVERFSSHGFLPDYDVDLAELGPGVIRFVQQRGVSAEELVSRAESAFSRLNAQIEALQRTLRARTSELQAADHHIATLEEKIFTLKEAKRELKQLTREKQVLRKSPERRIGQVLLAPYRLPQKLIRALRRSSHASNRTAAPSADALEYQRWFEQHRATPKKLEAMRTESRKFANQPLISVITPVFNTPVRWLEQAVASVIEQVYENWELILVDDASTDPAVAKYLAALEQRDSRVRIFRLERNVGISAASNYALEQARGEWIGLLDHDDLLEPDALFQTASLLQQFPDADLIYSDEDKLSEAGLERPQFKPDWSPDLFLSCNYISHFTTVGRALVERVGGFRSEFDGAQDYDLLLRVIEQTDRIHHIPRVLYHWRRSASSSAIDVRQKPGQLEAARRAIEQHLHRQGTKARVATDWPTHTFWVRRELTNADKISIIIPASDDNERLSRCLESISAKTSYPNYEIVIVDSKSAHQRLDLGASRSRRLVYAWPVNAAAMNNFAVKQTDSPWLLFLRDDVEVIDDDWLTSMAEHIQRPEVGAVGACLLNPDGTMQHAGIVIGVAGVADEACRGLPAEDAARNRQSRLTRNCTAVSGACLLTRRDIFDQCGGFDEDPRLATCADVDLCLKIRGAGYLIVYTPVAKLRCHETAARIDNIEASEIEAMQERWGDVLARDPYYNSNLSRERADFSLGN
jgi:GT2 family glycosyltransferase